jgi:hypothetical protein
VLQIAAVHLQVSIHYIIVFVDPHDVCMEVKMICLFVFHLLQQTRKDHHVSLDGTVSVMTGYGLDDWGSGTFLFTKLFRPAVVPT